MMYDFGIVTMGGPGGLALVVGIALWALFWKGLALWHSARRGQHWWFVAILVINLVGVVELIYLFFIAKLKPGELFSFKK